VLDRRIRDHFAQVKDEGLPSSQVDVPRDLVCGVIGTNVLARPAYGDANFVNVNIALFSVSIALLLQSSVVVSSRQRLVGFSLLWLLAVVASAEACAAANFWFGAPQADRSKYRFAMKPADDAVYQVVRSITKQDGDLLSLIFRQATYVKAGRLPASKNLYYLPWQADYDKILFRDTEWRFARTSAYESPPSSGSSTGVCGTYIQWMNTNRAHCPYW